MGARYERSNGSSRRRWVGQRCDVQQNFIEEELKRIWDWGQVGFLASSFRQFLGGGGWIGLGCVGELLGSGRGKGGKGKAGAWQETN